MFSKRGKMIFFRVQVWRLLSGLSTCFVFIFFFGLSKSLNPEPFIIFGNTVDIRRVNLDGTGYNYIVRGLTNVVGLDFDIKTQMIYWSDIGVKKIQRVHINNGLDPGKIEDFIVEDLGIPEDLAIDWTGRKLFWTDANKKIIEIINLDGTQRQELISTGHDKPRAIVVDPANDRVYWTDWGSEPKILRAKMSDGTQKEVLVNSGIVWPNGLALDYVGKMLYWADANTDKIEKSHFYGQNRSILIDRTRVYHPYALTQFGSRLYWSDWQRHSIEHCNKNTGDDRVTITGGMTRPTALHVYHPDRQPGADFNECQVNNGGCSHTCLDLIGGYKCLCPSGFELASDDKTCQDINECSYNRGGCEHLCINFPGSYNCSCLQGYTLQSDKKTCQDADECRINNGGCEFSCNNTESSYYCSCRSGYMLAADKHSCLDIDECQTLTHQCPDQCENTAGSYKCLCSSGLTLYNPLNKTCDDINECLTSQHSCQQLCVNTRGSFHCDCNPGFLLSGDQLTCADADECSQSNHSCQHRCVNTIGSYVCSCDAGHILSDDGRTCDLTDCGRPDGLAGIVVKCDGSPDQYSFGKVCTLTCTKGFLIGSSIITCQASGQWSVITVQCASQLPGSNSPPLGILLSSPFISENSPPNTVIGRLTTVDNDEEQFFTYSLIDGVGVFSVDSNASTLVLVGEVDYERQSVYTVSLASTDSGVPQLSVMQNLTVHITDVNEPPNPPTISSSVIYENASLGTVIGVLNSSDVDSGQEIIFSLLTNAGDRFRIVGHELRLHSKLNYEETSSFRLTVEAKDDGSPTLSSVSIFNITVMDCNDPPTRIMFSRGSIPEYSEHSPGGTHNGSVIGNFTTIDEDVGQLHTYSIVGGSEVFSINKSSLVVSWAERLNFESHDLWTLQVRSTDPVGASVTSSVEIRLLDVNENPSGILLSADSFLEHAPLDTVVGSLSARDPDLHNNHTFALVSNPNSIFSVEGKTLKVSADVDFETTTTNPLTIVLRTTDRAGLSFEETLNITVLDKNEPPTDIVLYPRKPCASSSGICVEENSLVGYRIGDIAMADPDRGDSGVCDVVSDDIFKIENGAVLVNGKINFEALDSSRLISVDIICRDKGGLSIEKSFNISVLDANDAPSAVALSHQIVNSNASVGSLVGSFIVVDEDRNDTHFCYLLDPDSLFRVAGLQLFVRKPLINATSARHPIHVFCSDGEKISFPRTLYIEVRSNLLSTQVNVSLDSTDVKENEPAGSVVGSVTAKTSDPNDTLVFQMDDDANGTFALLSGSDVNSRELVTTRPLDYEEENEYNVVIRVYGSGGATNFEVFRIQVIDVYEPPEHLILHHNYVAENLAGTLVGVITLKDPQLSPLSAELLYDPGSAFELRPTSVSYTWKLMTRRPLDYETDQVHQITVQVKDTNNSFAVNQSFTIHVTNVNEAPTSIALSNHVIEENSPQGTVVGLINVTDPDEAFVPQSIACGLRNDAGGRFKVSGMALIVLESRMLNFEAPDGPNHLVDIECQDQDGEATQQQFVVELTDVDEPPIRIESSSGKFEVSENLNPGSLIAILRTIDQDTWQNHSYSVTPDTLFSIAGDRLETRVRFNYEQQNVYLVNITTTDSGNQSLTQGVVVSVLDVNDAPTGIVLPQGTAIAENTKVGSLIGEMTSLDEDSGQTHTYVIQAQTPSGVISLGDVNKLYVADSAALNYELHRQVNITVTTTDNGLHSRLSKVVTLSLPILDVNEPPYGIELAPASVKENSPIETVVGVITVQDPDTFPQWFLCRLRDDAAGRFGVKINMSRIELFLTGNGLPVNYEKHTSHNVTLLCSDNGGLSYEKDFVIQVLDANDPPSNVIFTDSPGDTILSPNPPVNTTDIKLVTQAVATVNETADVGITIVAYVQVIDEDNANNPVRPQTHACELVSEAEAKLLVTVDVHAPSNSRRKRSSDLNSVPTEFMIQPGTNSILVREQLDYETRSNYTLYVKCTDNGVPKMSIVNSLLVFVLDVPEAPTDVIFSSLTIAENASNGEIVSDFTVVDADSTRTGYSFELTSRGVPFRLIGNLIVVSRVPLDHEATPLITVQLATREVLTDLIFVKTFDVAITDVNEPPSSVTLDGKTKVEILESSPIGYVLGKFVVEDQDVYDTSFSIAIEGDQNEIIADFAVSGQNLEVASQLNAWSRDRYLLKVSATDRGGLSTSNILTINVAEVDVCSMNKSYCSPYAICSRAGPGRASCACKLGFTGDGLRCSDINYCDPDPCHRGNTIGGCQDGFGGWNNYSCNCRPGWSPPDCNVEINECRPSPCNASGTENCENLINDFKCKCKPGFSGRLCDTNIDDCKSASCLNGGTCVDKVNGFICLCKDPYIGVNCDTDDTICRENPTICPRNGTCISYAEDPTKFSCRCEEPWGGNCSGCAPGYGGQNCTPCRYPRTGENCELDWRNCEPDPCLQGGTCYPLRGEDFSCVCPPNYFGKTCDKVAVVTEDGSRSGKRTGLSPAGLYSLIGCIVLLCIIILVIIIVWRRRKRRKYRSKNARIEYHNKRQRPEVSSPFREMMQRSEYNFENPAFIAEPEGDGDIKPDGDAPKLDRAPTVTEIKISGDTVAIARDNPMYEPVEEVLRKHSAVVHNPIFVDDSAEENTRSGNSRLWRRPDQHSFSKC